MNKKVALIPLAGLMVVGAACSSSPAPAKTSGVIASTSTAPGIPGLEGGAPLVNGEIAPTTTTTAAPSNAVKLYDAFTKKYAGELADLKAAYPDQAHADPWQNELDSACSPPDTSGDGMAVLLIGPILQKHGHDFVTFKGDANKVDAAVRADGLCPKG